MNFIYVPYWFSSFKLKLYPQTTGGFQPLQPFFLVKKRLNAAILVYSAISVSFANFALEGAKIEYIIIMPACYPPFFLLSKDAIPEWNL